MRKRDSRRFVAWLVVSVVIFTTYQLPTGVLAWRTLTGDEEFLKPISDWVASG